MISRRTGTLAVLAATLLVVGLGLGNGPLIVWGLTVGGLAVAALSVPPPSGVRAALAVQRRRAQVGDTMRVRVDVEITRGYGPVLVHAGLPDSLQLLHGSNVSLVWKGPRRARQRFEFTVRAARRGAAQIGPVTTQPIHPLRVRAEAATQSAAAVDLVVQPRVRRVARMRQVRGQAVTVQPAGDAARLGARGQDFEEIRPYLAGDPMHSINWKATARLSHDERTELMVNEFAPEGKKAIWLFLDAGLHMEVGSTRENALDHALEGTLGILQHFSARGYRIGATLFHQPETRVFYPDVGSRQLQRLTAALSTVVAFDGGEALDRAVLRSRGFLLRERPLVLLVTRPEVFPLATRKGLAEIRSLTGHGARTTPVLLFAPTPVAHSLAGGHHPLTAAALRLAARGTYQTLRRQGVRVLDWDPAHLPLERILVREMVAR